MQQLLQAVWTEDGDLLVNLDKLFDSAATFMLYVTLAFAAICFVWLGVASRNAEKFAKTKKIVVGIAVGYAVATIALLGYLKMAYYVLDGKINVNFWLVVGLFALVATLLVVGLLLKRFAKDGEKIMKWYAPCAVAVVAACAVVSVIVIPAKKDYYEPLSKAGMYVFTALLVAVVAVLTVLFGKREKSVDATKEVAYAAICLALSYALSYVKFFSLPQGGSVTFASLLPLMLYSYMFGARKGVLAGVVYGLLQFVQSPQFYQPMQVLLDYPIAFGAIGVAGIGRNLGLKNVTAQFVVGAVAAGVLRYLAHVISGYYVFSSWAMEGYTAFSWAVVYNLFVIVDVVIVVVAGALLFASRSARAAILSAGE